MIINFILICFAAFCNAIMDKTTHHFDDSIFSTIKNKKIRQWFNTSESWKNKYIDKDVKKGRVKWVFFGFVFNKPVQLTDSWHFFKMLMVFSVCFLPVSYYVYIDGNHIFFGMNPMFNMVVYWILLGISWNLVFGLFYNKLLVKKKHNH